MKILKLLEQLIKELHSISNCVKEYNINNTIDKEVEYLDRYKQIKKNNPKLLEFVEKYFKYNDKYQVLDLVEEVRVLYGLGNEIDLNGGKH